MSQRRRALSKHTDRPNAASGAVIGAQVQLDGAQVQMQVLSWTDDEIAQLDSRLQQHRGGTLTRLQNTVEQLNASLQALDERFAQVERIQQTQHEGYNMFVTRIMALERRTTGLVDLIRRLEERLDNPNTT